jgi:hypothetical protein
MVLILIFAEVLGLYGCAASPLFSSLPLITPPQTDRGVDHEHKGDRIEVLVVTFSTCNPRLLSVPRDCRTTSIVYHRSIRLTVPLVERNVSNGNHCPYIYI